MGMTDAQFKAFVRFIIDALEAADPNKENEKVQKVIDNLQKTLED